MLKLTCAAVLAMTSFATAQTGGAQTNAQRCERVAQLNIANTTVNAQLVSPGGFTAPGDPPPPAIAERYKSLPQFCRVTAHAHPSNDSDIVIEIWLPASGWNGRFQAIGTGGFAGVIPYPNLATVLNRGYVTASTDTGHTTGANAEWALGHPEKIIDYGYRGIHEMTGVAKAAISAFYGNNAQHSYFVGCSNGGRQALMEAQRYPDDYDGILAGAPANNWTRLLTTGLSSMQAMGNDPESYIPAAKWKAVETVVNNACDANDGVRDGIVNDPRQCRFDPATMQCKPGDADNACLTAKQVVALKKIYQGAQDSHGRQIFFGLLPGAESRSSGWESWVSGEALGKGSGFFFGKEYFSNMVYQDKAWDYHTANIEAALKAADERTKALNATDPDLSKLAKHGGKLILYHGWNDPAIPATSTVDYFEAMQKKMGAAATDNFTRLYMVPGMQHCGGGPGATALGGNVAPFEPERNILSALELWVEKGVAPGTIIASKPGSTMTRPLCPYPQAPTYNGSGDVNSAASFTCK